MIKYVQPVGRSSAMGVTARVYEGMRREFGVHAEPIALHSPAPELLAGAWMVCRETLVAAGRVEREVKEAVATAVSSINSCPFCVDVHAAMLAATGKLGSARRLERGQYENIEPALAKFVEWAAATRSPGAEILRAPPFDDQQAPELIGTALLFHYINRPVSVFCEESPFPVRGQLLKGGMLRLAGRRFRSFTSARPAAGETLDLLPEVELPEDFGWARGSASLAGAWARFADAVERAAEGALSDDVRTRVLARLQRWQGESPELTLDWLNDGLEGVAERERPAAQLALLTALSPFRVDGQVIDVYRDGRPDSDVIAVVAWASLATARRIAGWLAPGV